MLHDAKCFALVRQHRWPEGVRCPHCGGTTIARDSHDETQWHRQRYRGTTCAARFNDLTGTVLSGHHQPLRIWVLCLHFMGLNVSNQQIAQGLDLCISDVQTMTEQLRSGITAKLRPMTQEGTVEADEVYVVAGTKATRPPSPKKAAAATAQR